MREQGEQSVLERATESVGSRAWFDQRVGDFNVDESLRTLGALAEGSAGRGFDTASLQVDAWKVQLTQLHAALQSLTSRHADASEWHLFLEYEIPRRQKRIDVVLLSPGVVFVIECKVGTPTVERAALWQAEDYALDLRDFHERCAGMRIVPILWATGGAFPTTLHEGTGLPTYAVGRLGLADVLAAEASNRSAPSDDSWDPAGWDHAAYQPTPSIIQATKHLFARHTVANLSHHYADNLDATVRAVVDAATAAERDGRRTICFVTGVPGAGKTLAGLAAINAIGGAREGDTRGAYMSGNGPLVEVLRAAIAEDSADRIGTKREAMRRAATLVQNVHEFIEEYGVKKPSAPPHESIVAFDEAQRAWDARKLGQRHKLLKRSEPALMLDIMERSQRPAVLICLVGGGQEIHSGEAGLEEWGRALRAHPDRWRVVASPDVLSGADSTAHHRLFTEQPPDAIEIVPTAGMHLNVSVRSPRAQQVAEWVNAVLSLDASRARRALESMDGFRLGLTRSLATAKQWLQDAGRDELRPGLVTSSGNLRLRAYGIEIAPEFLHACSLPHWFLAPASDIRSSAALELAMTEFKVQGLELDFIGMCWGDDLTVTKSNTWKMQRFRGTKWVNVKRDVDQRYLLNKYRVLLTRAREGMVIWVPPGNAQDRTRDPARLDRTAEFLEAAGVSFIDS